MSTISVVEVSMDLAPWDEIHSLLDVCYPKPPRDVFNRVVGASHRQQRLFIAREQHQLLGMVMLSPHSKGGHLDNLSVAPAARRKGLGKLLVRELLAYTSQGGPAMVSLTTRIPGFFVGLGFTHCGELSDGSTAMVILLNNDINHPALSV